MSTFSTCTSATRPGSPTDGDVLFETDTKNVIIWDGTNWRGYQNDGIRFSGLTNTYSVDFDGTDDYLALGSSATLFDSTTAFSVSAWIDLDAYSPDTFPTICMLKTDQSTGWMLGLSNFSSSYNGVWMGSSANFAGLTTGDASLASSLLTGWHHIVVTFDGVSRLSASSFKLYVDGSSKTLSSSGTYGSTSNTNQIGFGNGNNTRFNGKIDEVSIYNSQLTSANVTTIYNSGVGGVNISSLSPLGWWRMGDNDSGTGTTVTDQGSGGNDATLTNGPTFSTSVPS